MRLMLSLSLFLGACSAPPPGNVVSEESVQSPTEVVKVTAAALVKAYGRNEAAAQRDYGGKTIEISGEIRVISLDLGDEPRVALAVPGQTRPVNVTFDKGGDSAGVADLEKGAVATFRCTNVGEVLGNPYVEGCRVWG